MPNDSEHHNQLTPAEAERLAILAEEMGETIHVIGKILRHGYESYNPFVDYETNRSLLNKELGDVRYAMMSMCNAGDLSEEEIHKQADLKARRIREFLHHQESNDADK